jgi:hypothetical protein
MKANRGNRSIQIAVLRQNPRLPHNSWHFHYFEAKPVHPERLRALVAQLQVMQKYQQLSCLEIAARLNAAQEPTLSGEWRWFEGTVRELLHDPSRGAL